MSRVGDLPRVDGRQNVAQPARSVLKEERAPPGVEQAPDALARLKLIAVACRRLVNGADTIREVAFNIDHSTQPGSPDWQPRAPVREPPGPRPIIVTLSPVARMVSNQPLRPLPGEIVLGGL
jgi:hypothetical protein